MPICRPNTGQQVKQETLGELKKKYKKVTWIVWFTHIFSHSLEGDFLRIDFSKCCHFIWYQVTAEECEEHWQKQFESSAKTCSHAFWKVKNQRLLMQMITPFSDHFLICSLLIFVSLICWIDDFCLLEGEKQNADADNFLICFLVMVYFLLILLFADDDK